MTDSAHDALVVGGRCAGAATALLLARAGHDVRVVERAAFPSDALSTHALSRGGVVLLARWGLLDAVLGSGAPPVRRVSFHAGREVVVRRVRDRAGVDLLVAPRRHVLDPILLGAAAAAGATVEVEATVVDLLTDRRGRAYGAVVRGRDGCEREVRARVVVGADGVRSRVARIVGARVVDERPSPSATCYAYVAGLDAAGFEYHLAERRFAGVFPTHGGEANVWLCAPAADAALATGDRAGAFLGLLAQASPSLARRVAAAGITSPVRCAARLPNHVREAAGPGWALAGDAACHRDPITGHGITDAFRDAELLAGHLHPALRAGVPVDAALAAYDAERRRALQPVFDVTCRLAAHPPVDAFRALQRGLAELLDAEAAWLAARAGAPPGDPVAA